MIQVSQLRPLKKTGPGRPFVNREKEKELVQAQVDKGIRGEDMSTEVICFWVSRVEAMKSFRFRSSMRG